MDPVFVHFKNKFTHPSTPPIDRDEHRQFSAPAPPVIHHMHTYVYALTHTHTHTTELLNLNTYMPFPGGNNNNYNNQMANAPNSGCYRSCSGKRTFL